MRTPPRRIGLLTTLDTNIGDDFIRDGLVWVLKGLLGGAPVEWVAVNKHHPVTVYPSWHPIRWFYANGFQGRRRTAPIRRQLEHRLPRFGFSRFDSCDFIVQCGTPIIWEGCRHCEWGKLIWSDVLARLARRGATVLNLGGGTCYPWERQPETLQGSADEEFIRLMLQTARLTTTRDPLGRKLFASLGWDIPQVACPALLAGQSHTQPAAPARKVVVNYMEGGGHFDLGQGIDPVLWENTMRAVIAQLQREKWEPFLLAHSQAELDLAARLWPDLPRSMARSTAEYFQMMRGAAFGVLNRLHAAVAAAGLGIPSVAVGTDTRNLMVRALGSPVFFVKEATAPAMLSAIRNLAESREKESKRLLDLREQTAKTYAGMIQPILAQGS